MKKLLGIYTGEGMSMSMCLGPQHSGYHPLGLALTLLLALRDMPFPILNCEVDLHSTPEC